MYVYVCILPIVRMTIQRIIWSFSPVHNVGSAGSTSRPLGQPHLNPPGTLLQVKVQLSLPSAHSSMSTVEMRTTSTHWTMSTGQGHHMQLHLYRWHHHPPVDSPWSSDTWRIHHCWHISDYTSYQQQCIHWYLKEKTLYCVYRYTYTIKHFMSCEGFRITKFVSIRHKHTTNWLECGLNPLISLHNSTIVIMYSRCESKCHRWRIQSLVEII